MKNIFEQLTDLLKKNERLVSQDDMLLKNQTQELARKNDPELIKLLLSDKAIKQHFFFEVERTLIFDKEKFIRFISNKQFLPDSYTAFKNKIGLSAGDEYVSENKEVVLAWPYKDCVLEGGMTKEDQKRDEIFYNETLAPDDINRLLDAKVFTNFKRVDKKGEHKLDGFKRDGKGTIKDNLIIKGNNLLALASLKKEFAGKVKLIYIDPPYNTGNDGFKYNDSFNHSSWLVFMKNRLEIAKQLLSDDGSIFVQTDYNESHYLKILMDQIFGPDNFRNEIIWHYENKFKFEFTKNFNNDTESILFYSKKNGQQFFKHIRVDVKNKRKQNKITWDKNLKKMVTVKDASGKVVYYESTDKIVGTLWNIPRINSQSKERLGLIGQKPEELIKRVLMAVSEQDDIVLDFFAGTGTSGAVAHKMNRQYILIEQLDYIHDLPEARLKRVIKGDQTGISKDVGWKGGGDFVYMELARWNEKWIEKIEKAKTGKELAKFWEEMKETAFLSYKVNPKTVDANAKDIADLSVADQKKFLIECLDKNQLYVNLSEIEDKEYGVSKVDIKLNREFYGK